MASKHDVTEHKIGTMDITEHKRTFAGFVRFSAWVAGVSIVTLIFLALVNS